MVIAVIAATIGIMVNSVYVLSILSSDLVYVIVFPQLLCCIHISFTNTYGSVAGFIIGLILRFTAGESLLDFKPVIEYPWYDKENGAQYFPYRTFSMLISLATVILVSLCSKRLFKMGILPSIADIAKVYDRVEVTPTHEMA